MSRVVERVKLRFEVERVAGRVAEWEDKKVAGLQRGELVHAYIERVLRSQELPAAPQDPFLAGNEVLLPEMEAFDAWWANHRSHVILLATEWIIGDRELGIAGTLDSLVYSSRTRRHHILDWKTNSRFGTSSRWQKLLEPFADLDDCELSCYSLQLSLYRLILERTLPELTLGDSYLIHLSRDGRPTAHRALDLRHRALEWLTGHYEVGQLAGEEGA